MANLPGINIGKDAILIHKPPFKDLVWDKDALCIDGDVIAKSYSRLNNYGAYVCGKVLYLNGEPIAKSNKPALQIKDGNLVFGDVELNTYHKVINITLDDYNTLYAGGLVTGYKRFDPDAIYNIVDDVANSENIDYDSIPEKDIKDLTNIIYNNIVGLNVEPNVLTDATFTDINTPKISIHDYEYKIKEGDKLTFMVMVDSDRLDKLLANTIGDTFTVIVKDKFSRVLFSRTIYAGEINVELESFKDENNQDNYVGQTWFSVECIDNHGRGSAVRYYDLLIESADIESNMYEMQESDLETYNIHINDSDEEHAYANKQGFTDLFNAIKQQGYSGIKVYNPNGDDIYYINYHEKVSYSDNRPDDFGEFAFYLQKVVSYLNENNVKQYKKEGSLIPIVFENGQSSVTIDGQTFTFNDVPLEFVRADAAQLYRVTEAQVQQYSVNGVPTFVGDSPRVLTADDVNKIWVIFRNSLDDLAIADDNDNPRVKSLYVYDPNTMVYYGSQYNIKYLRTYTSGGLSSKITSLNAALLNEGVVVDSDDEYPDDTQNVEEQSDDFTGWFYVVSAKNSAKKYIEFPDNFIVDFNNTTLKAIACPKPQTYKGGEPYPYYGYLDVAYNGSIIKLHENYNTTIKNLTIDGLVENFDWVASFLIQGASNGGICEGINNILTVNSKFCTFDNVISKNALCYDARSVGGQNSPNIYTNKSAAFENVGYIDYNGNIQTQNAIIRKIDSTTNEALVYDSTYRRLDITQAYERKSGRYAIDEFSLGGMYKYRYANGKHFELFVVFYEEVDNEGTITYQHVSTVKTYMWYRVKIPTGATHFRIVGYGVSKIVNGENVSNLVESPYLKSNNRTPYVVNSAFPTFEPWVYMASTHNKCILYRNCTWQDSRSTVLSVETSKCVTYDNCVFERIAYIPSPSADWDITPLLGAFEDGRQNTAHVTIKNCIVNCPRIVSKLPNVADKSKRFCNDKYVVNFFYCRDLTIKHNSGFSYQADGNVSDAYLYDNVFITSGILRGNPFAYRHVIIRKNAIISLFNAHKELTAIYNNKKGTVTYGGITVRGNQCDDELSLEVVYEDQIAVEDSNYSQSVPNGNKLTNPVYKRSMIGTKFYK